MNKRLVSRTSIGLDIEISIPISECLISDNSILYSDDMFVLDSETYNLFREWNAIPDNSIRVDRNKKIFVPQANPRTKRLVRNRSQNSFFTYGELNRYRLLRLLPSYPFKPHQESGVEWLVSRKAAILADDMGLGKTLQAIAAVDSLVRSSKIRNAIVVCPKSLIGVWESELDLWAPHLCKVSVVSVENKSQWEKVSRQSHIVITNYETVQTIQPDNALFDLAILDEIHKLKNPRSNRYNTLLKLDSQIIWGLTGTPLENNASELSSILHLLDQKRVSINYGKFGTVSVRNLASKYILRRSKHTLANELPEINEKIEYVPLTTEQRISYQYVLSECSSSSTNDWIAVFNQLRQICDFDPRTKSSSKVDRILEIVKAILGINEKVVVFSYLVKPLQLLKDRLTVEADSSPGAVNLLSGAATSHERKTIIEQFQTSSYPRILLCTTKALAEGVTLTGANHVIFLNEWWNPSINSQARDRVFRIGQQRNVTVYKLRTIRTVENRLGEILENKSLLFSEIVSKLCKDTMIEVNKFKSVSVEIEPLNSIGKQSQ